jgi:hypothetical protein
VPDAAAADLSVRLGLAGLARMAVAAAPDMDQEAKAASLAAVVAGRKPTPALTTVLVVAAS